MRRFHHEPLPAVDEQVTLEPNASRHLLKVLRLKAGTRIQLFAGTGEQVDAVVDGETDDGLALVTGLTSPVLAAPRFETHLVLGIPKGPATDLAIRMATEAGVTHIHPVIAARSVAKGDRSDRWQKIAASAAQQCKRADVPEILPLRRLSDVWDRLPEDRRMAHPGAGAPLRATADVAILIGPEGGWTDAEVAQAVARGCKTFSLGSWILRADTASAVAVALVTAG